MILRSRSHVHSLAVGLALAASACAGGAGGASDTATVTSGRLDSVTLAAPPTVAAAPETIPAHGTSTPPRLGAPPRVPGVEPAAGATATGDSVRGIVSVVGAVPATAVVVRPEGAASITITGPLAREIGEASGAEVVVVGSGGGRTIAATRYEVTRVDGRPAVDGTIARDGERFALVTASGRRPVAAVPQTFGALVGARVWATLDAQGNVVTYGVLRR